VDRGAAAGGGGEYGSRRRNRHWCSVRHRLCGESVEQLERGEGELGLAGGQGFAQGVADRLVGAVPGEPFAGEGGSGAVAQQPFEAGAILGQVGDAPKQAYDVMVGVGVISFFLPYLAMFAALIKLQAEPAGADVMQVPGGRPIAMACGITGLLASLASIFLASVPSEGEPHPERHVVKVVGLSLLLVLSGVGTCALGKWKQ